MPTVQELIDAKEIALYNFVRMRVMWYSGINESSWREKIINDVMEYPDKKAGPMFIRRYISNEVYR